MAGMSFSAPRMRMVKQAIGAFFAIFIGIAACLLYLLDSRRSQLDELATYNVTFLTAQASTEILRLRQLALSHAAGEAEVAQEDVQLALDILANRLSVIRSGRTRQYLIRFGRYEPVAQALGAALQAGQAQVDRWGGTAPALELARIFQPLEDSTAGLASLVHGEVAHRITASQDTFNKLQLGSLLMLATIALCGIGLSALLWWLQAHNRLVQERDHDLKVQNLRFNVALTNMSQALAMFDGEDRLVVCNGRFREMFGLPEQLVAPGTPAAEVFDGAARHAPYGAEMVRRMRGRLLRLTEASGAGAVLEENRNGAAVSATVQSMADGGWVATFEDVTERHRAESRIAHMALHDALTGLPNRVMLRDRLERALAELKRGGARFAVFYLDLDHFKDVNDTLGHPIGDALLREAAARLLACVREGDVVARLGGDEFAILQSGQGTEARAAEVAERVIQAIGTPFDLDGHRVTVGTSIGIALCDGTEEDADALLRRADLALYRAKEDGRGTWRFFEPEMERQATERHRIETELREALPRGELSILFQPQLSLRSGRIAGCEALLRWRHARMGDIPPSLFVPVAEKIGLILRLGEHVLRVACREAASWPEDVRVAVNLSAVQFTAGDVPATVARVLAETGLPPQRLELEVTESVLIRDDAVVLEAMRALKRLGVRLSLDDFGTGYSSLSYLLRFPFDKVKIDRAFVRAGESRAEAEAIVRHITSLARHLGMTTTAEGVETLEQLDDMRAADCDEVQGFLVGRPCAAQDLRVLLEARPEAPPLAGRHAA
jgi:diguanylate cyclase (GGDEF)-like protein